MVGATVLVDVAVLDVVVMNAWVGLVPLTPGVDEGGAQLVDDLVPNGGREHHWPSSAAKHSSGSRPSSRPTAMTRRSPRFSLIPSFRIRLKMLGCTLARKAMRYWRSPALTVDWSVERKRCETTM